MDASSFGCPRRGASGFTNRTDEVRILTKSADISYAGCGLPYYVGGMIASREELIVNTPQKHRGLTGADVVTGCEVTAVDPVRKVVTAKTANGTGEESYDKLIIATGAVPFVPAIEGTTPEGGKKAFEGDVRAFLQSVIPARCFGPEAVEATTSRGETLTVFRPGTEA